MANYFKCSAQSSLQLKPCARCGGARRRKHEVLETSIARCTSIKYGRIERCDGARRHRPEGGLYADRSQSTAKFRRTARKINSDIAALQPRKPNASHDYSKPGCRTRGGAAKAASTVRHTLRGGLAALGGHGCTRHANATTLAPIHKLTINSRSPFCACACFSSPGRRPHATPPR